MICPITTICSGGNFSAGIFFTDNGFAATLDQFLHGVGNLRALALPVAHTVQADAQLIGAFRDERVVKTDALDEAAVAAIARIGNHDVVKRAVFGAAARESNDDHGKSCLEGLAKRSEIVRELLILLQVRASFRHEVYEVRLPVAIVVKPGLFHQPAVLNTLRFVRIFHMVFGTKIESTYRKEQRIRLGALLEDRVCVEKSENSRQNFNSIGYMTPG